LASRNVGGNPNYYFPKIMRTSLALLCLLAVGADASAADSTTPSDTTKKPAVRQVVAPTISATRAVRNPDGTLSFVCIDRPNPKATQLLQKARATHVLPDQN
jgi:hypothetical protein